MLTHEMAAIWVKKDEEAGRIPKGDQLGLLGKEIHVQGLKSCNNLARHWRTINSALQVRSELWRSQ